MMKNYLLLLLIVLALNEQVVLSQSFFHKSHKANSWVRHQFKLLTQDEKIAQLMVIRAHSNLGTEHFNQVSQLIKKYNIGSLCFFQGGPIRQALLTNYYQSIAKTPLMISIDAEWGLGMRLDSVINFPRQLMLGATTDPQLIYNLGIAVGKQCKRMGINVNYAPVVDINNNPENPVINDRSFGEDKYKVASFGVAYMKGMQDMNIMACAKHFPGHGDVSVDSHLDLPVINKTFKSLDTLELYPFKKMIKAGVGSIMMAHLYIPAIDTTAHLATSLSKNAVNNLLKNKLNFNGITITDGLEMKGISKFYPDGEASTQALIAGNDMLCLPSDIEGAINKVKEAIANDKLKWKQINKRVKKVLLVKYNMGLNNYQPIDTANLLSNLNQSTALIKKQIATNSITCLKNNSALLPINNSKKIAYLGIGLNADNVITNQLKASYNCDNYFFTNKVTTARLKETIEPSVGVLKKDTSKSNDSVTDLIKTLESKKYDIIIVGVHNYSRRPASNYGLSDSAISLLNKLQQNPSCVLLFFGNPYAIRYACNAATLFACYEDDEAVQQVALDILMGKLSAKGKLPVTVCNDLKYGSGL